MTEFRDVTLRDLEAFAARLEERFLAKSPNRDPQFRAYLQIAKMGEEFGETCDALIQYFGKQREDKTQENPKENLEDEMADLVLTVLNLSARLGLSVSDGLARKTAVVAGRVGVQPVVPPSSASAG